MKRNWIFTICLLSGLALLCFPHFCTSIHTDVPDISSLETENISSVCKPISFEDAVHLEAKVSATIDRYAKENLQKTEKEIRETAKSSVSYYQFTGTFSFSEIQEFQGVLTTLIIVANDSAPYIYEIRDPFTEIQSNRTDIQWVPLDSSASISTDKMSARVAAMGYFTMAGGNQSGQDILSNTVYPAFTIQLPPAKAHGESPEDRDKTQAMK